MFSKILIANRGEIACRIITTAQKLGIKTVAVYSDADKNARHVKMADEAVRLGPAPSRDSYLIAEKVIAAAKLTGAEAIHPGYGFLSENSHFCKLCEQENISFIGPPVSAIEAMGSKSAAKSIMEKADVPLVPGYHGDDQSADIIKKAADDMGYPVLLKATAGGGGKGMRQIWSADEFAEGFDAVKREALNAFGDDTMLVEKYLTAPRHVEIQVFCDQNGNAVYLFERDCSVQRRHQKVIEEAPAFGMPESLRKKMGEAAIKSAQAIGYVGAGTVEFLLNPNLADLEKSEFYFMEMNTRLQVEHPVTEMITGEDLVEWQLRVAAGEPLPKTQQALTMKGHAFEARIYAEDPNNDFLPATGTLSFLKPPQQSRYVRVDTGVEEGDEVSVFYDPMIAKLIVWDENRDLALQRLKHALKQYRIHGVTTNIDFLYQVAACQDFADERIDTGFIEKHHEALFELPTVSKEVIDQQLIQASLAQVLRIVNNVDDNSDDDNSDDSGGDNKSFSPWHKNNAFRLNQKNLHKFELMLDDSISNDLQSTKEKAQYTAITVEQHSNQGRMFDFSVNLDSSEQTIRCQAQLTDHALNCVIDGHKTQLDVVFVESTSDTHALIQLFTENGAVAIKRKLADLGESNNSTDDGGLHAPMNGTMVDVLVAENDVVTEGQALVIMEAMKMEHTIRAPSDGMITATYYKPGDMVDGGSELIGFESNDAKGV